MPDPSQKAPDKITHLDLMQEPTKEQAKRAVAELSAALKRPSTTVISPVLGKRLGGLVLLRTD
jgi:hypothetical protein